MTGHRRDVEELAERFVRGYGLVSLPLPELADLMTAGPTQRAAISEAGRVMHPADAVAFLSTLTHPATRHVLFPLTESWSVVVNNERNGSDFNDTQPWIARRTPAMTIRVVDTAATTAIRGEFELRTGYEARIVEIMQGETSVRTIACADDGGRWVFETTGEPLDVEGGFNYAARRKKDRFTRDNLGSLLTSLGARRVLATDFVEAPLFVLIHEDMHDDAWRRALDADACSIEEADDPAYGYYQRAMGWVKHITTHAESAVMDLTIAVLFNPAYDRRARPHLRQARRQLGRAEFERVVTHARASLRRPRS
jgi:hypothetical protein